MNYRGIEIACPACKADVRRLKEDGEWWCCGVCRRRFPVVVGIPDLRVRSDPYIDMEGDRAKGSELAERSAGLNFEESVELYYTLASRVPASQAQQFKRGLMSASDRAEAALSRWEEESQGGRKESLLEIGCGTAPLLVVASRQYERVVGIDIAFRWLVIARRRLEEAGVDVPLVCACAEALPFPDEAFDRVVADSVLEHVWDQGAAIGECNRVMRPAGYLFVSTPNRFSLGPDPHVGIWGGGYLPRRLVDAYVRRKGGNPPERRLLSSRSLVRLIRAGGFWPPRILLPDVAPGQRRQFGRGMRLAIDLYHLARRLPVSRHLLRWVGPLLHAVCEKPNVRPHVRAGGVAR